MEYKREGDTNCNWCTWNDPQKFNQGTEELEIRGQAETIQTPALLRSALAKKSPEDLRSLTVTHSSERPSPNIGVKNLQEGNNNNNDNIPESVQENET